jgi:hypothetical protein
MQRQISSSRQSNPAYAHGPSTGSDAARMSEQRLGHQVPGMRGLYAHASDGMRDDLKHALQTRWEDSLRARAAINPHSPLPLLDDLLAAEATNRNQATPGDREKMISQIPPSRSEARLAAALDTDVRLTAGHDLGSVWFETHAA